MGLFRETRMHLFECQVFSKVTGETYSSACAPFSWNGTIEGINGVKSDLLTEIGKSADLYDVRIISAVHLFGEE